MPTFNFSPISTVAIVYFSLDIPDPLEVEKFENIGKTWKKYGFTMFSTEKRRRNKKKGRKGLKSMAKISTLGIQPSIKKVCLQIRAKVNGIMTSLSH